MSDRPELSVSVPGARMASPTAQLSPGAASKATDSPIASPSRVVPGSTRSMMSDGSALSVMSMPATPYAGASTRDAIPEEESTVNLHAAVVARPAAAGPTRAPTAAAPFVAVQGGGIRTTAAKPAESKASEGTVSDRSSTGKGSEGKASEAAQGKAAAPAGDTGKKPSKWGRLRQKVDMNSLAKMTGEGILLFSEGRLGEAEVSFEGTVEALVKIVGKEHRDSVAAMHNLAHVKLELGNLVEAEKTMQEVVALNETLGSDRVKPMQRVLSLVNLAAAKTFNGDFDGAQTLLRSCRKQCAEEKTLGSGHHIFASVINNLAVLLIQRHTRRAVEASTDPLRKAPDSAEGGVVPVESGGSAELTEALALVKESIAIQQRALGPEHPRISSSLVTLAQVQRCRSDLVAARETLARAKALIETADDSAKKIGMTSGANDVDLAIVLNNLGELAMHDPKLYAEAETDLSYALAIRVEKLGDTHPDTAATLYNLGMLFLLRGDVEKATDHLRRAQVMCASVFGEDDWHTRAVAKQLRALTLSAGFSTKDFAVDVPVTPRE